jgi:ketosteroid isomerase-like protein
MSEADLRLIRHAVDLFNRRELERLMDVYVPESEWVMPAEWPDQRTYRGIDQIRELVLDVLQGFDDYRYDEERLVELEDGRVLGMWTIRAKVKGSGARVEMPLGTIYELGRPQGEPKLVRVTTYFSWQDAARGAGISESQAR